jgi:hypothetical protein
VANPTNTTGATSVYYTPYHHQFAPFFDGTNWLEKDFGGELSQALSDTTKSPAAAAANSNYDMFLWSDSGTYRCTRGPAWTSDSARGTGAGTTELTRVSGYRVNANAITNGPAANRGLYVGTIRTNGTTTLDMFTAASGTGTGCLSSLHVWNYYNRVAFGCMSKDTSGSHTYSSTTVRMRNNNASAKIQFIAGLGLDCMHATLETTLSGTATSRAYAHLSYDLTTGVDVSLITDGGSTGTAWRACTYLYGPPTGGYHYLAATEKAEVAGQVCTFYDGDGWLTATIWA